MTIKEGVMNSNRQYRKSQCAKIRKKNRDKTIGQTENNMRNL